MLAPCVSAVTLRVCYLVALAVLAGLSEQAVDQCGVVAGDLEGEGYVYSDSPSEQPSCSITEPCV